MIDAKPSAPRSRTDPRIARTKSALTEAFRQMIFADGLAAVTPRRLATLAKVGRSTFYAHYPSVGALLEASLADVLDPLATSLVAASP